MGYSVLVERTVKLSPKKVYDHLMDFGGVGKLVPEDVESVKMRGQGIGGVRVVRLKGMSDDLEERLEAGIENRMMSYSLIKPIKPGQSIGKKTPSRKFVLSVSSVLKTGTPTSFLVVQSRTESG